MGRYVSIRQMFINTDAILATSYFGVLKKNTYVLCLGGTI